MLTDLFISEIDDQYFTDDGKFCDFKHGVHDDAALHKNVTLKKFHVIVIYAVHVDFKEMGLVYVLGW